VIPATKRRAIDRIDQARNRRPTTRQDLERWIFAFTGIRVPSQAVCQGHSAPLDMFARQVFERPALALWHGPRGSGKSFLSAVDTHIASRFNPHHETRILGGSLAQSEQINQALREAVLQGRGPRGESDAHSIARLLKNQVQYRNGSVVSILAASAKSVRGPHVASLKLDEVDEIDPDIRESAMGMAMEKRGCRSSVLMTSTWHRVAGPMAELIDKGRNGAFPVHTYCVFEVLERCPEERSGKHLENCPQCPLVTWCHSDRNADPTGRPKAKRSAGHYTIDSLIQKVKAVSSRVFESDYLCMRPRASGVWFTMFDEATHVRETADFVSGWPVHLAIDPGVCTGAVWFQAIPRTDGRGHNVNVFADYYVEGISAESYARAIMEYSRRVCGNATDRLRVSMDSAGGARTSVGPTVRGEFERVGCQGKNGLESWPSSPKADGLQLLEALLKSADGTVSLTIHPRCRHLIMALQSYTRAKRSNQWMDYPKDPQHPHEDLIDPLVGGLRLEFPAGRSPEPRLRTVSARSVY
jgi:hypothetical protein